MKPFAVIPAVAVTNRARAVLAMPIRCLKAEKSLVSRLHRADATLGVNRDARASESRVSLSRTLSIPSALERFSPVRGKGKASSLMPTAGMARAHRAAESAGEGRARPDRSLGAYVAGAGHVAASRRHRPAARPRRAGPIRKVSDLF